MNRKRIDSTLEKQFVIAMVTSKAFLAGATPLLDIDLLPTRYVQQVATWCVQHYKQYGKAPGKGIQSIYQAWVERDSPSEDDADAIHDFLEGLSSQHDSTPDTDNAGHLLDELAGYLTDRKIAKLKDSIELSMLHGRRDEALLDIQEFRSVNSLAEVGSSLLGKDLLRKAFATSQASLIDFPTNAEWFFGNEFARDSLIAIQGPEKRGKTYWLIEFMYRAIRSYRTVAMFQVGDLSEAQFVRRWAMRIAGYPLWQYQCTRGVKVPTKIEVIRGTNGDEASVTHKLQTFPHPVDFATAYKAQKKFNRLYQIDRKRPTLKISTHQNSSINVAGIDAILERWSQEEGFVPDVVLIDYADILAPEDPRLEARHQVNATWKALARLRQKWHHCLITPTQADAASYDVKTQKMKNFSEDKRKLSHITAMLGLNQTAKEKTQGVMRLNWIVRREDEFDTNQCLWVAQCIPLGTAMAKVTR